MPRSHATRGLLGRGAAPSAIVYDNDVMALAGLGVAAELGVPVPARLSLLAWDDSALCRLAHPPLSAMSLDVHAMGVQVGDCVLNVLAGGPVASYAAPVPRLVARGSTAPPALCRARRRPARHELPADLRTSALHRRPGDGWVGT